MELNQTLLELETAGWEALSNGAGRRFYTERLTPDAVMLLPQVGLLSHDKAIDGMDGAPWSWFKIRNPQVVELGPDVAMLTYRVQARRDFDAEYQALVSSTYVQRDGEWKLAVHQQTPM
ncbi:MAG: nuclear transport factor 2 family protein [Acidimicrobiia bacterium]|nr:nuclear transport factor 2 family protein [Acidimicrobiia bacterium]